MARPQPQASAARTRARPRKINIHGWLVLDKPSGITSTEALNRVKRLFHPKKAGHAGTLDPLATGILPIAFGEATKTVAHAMDSIKTYRFTVRWGVETDTDDAEGQTLHESPDRPAREDILAVLDDFRGTIAQVPPRYSAIKVDGARAYDLAREGEAFELAARPVEIHRLDLVDMPDADHAIFEADCGKGAYVRALARDLGRALGCYGHVSALRRTRVGPFSEDAAVSIEELEKAAGEATDPAALQDRLVPVQTPFADLPEIAVSPADAARLRRGQAVLLRGRDAPILKGPAYACAKGVLVALCEVEEGALHPTRIFNLSK